MTELLEIIKVQQEQIKDLIDQNAVLTELLLQQTGIADREVIVGESTTASLGKIPWGIRRQKLEILHKRVKEEKEDAS